jgi:hypothetical protein
MKNAYSIFYIFIFGLFLLECSRDTIESESQSTLNSAPQKVTVIIDNIQFNSANISWSKAQDADNDSILYDIVLNTVIVLKDSKKLLFKLDNLLELTEYNGKIIAKDTHNNYSETSFNFKTLKYYLKYEKHIYFSLDPNYFSGLAPKEIIKLSDGYLIGGYTGKTNGAIFFALKIDANGALIKWASSSDVAIATHTQSSLTNLSSYSSSIETITPSVGESIALSSSSSDIRSGFLKK